MHSIIQFHHCYYSDLFKYGKLWIIKLFSNYWSKYLSHLSPAKINLILNMWFLCMISPSTVPCKSFLAADFEIENETWFNAEVLLSSPIHPIVYTPIAPLINIYIYFFLNDSLSIIIYYWLNICCICFLQKLRKLI